MIQVSVIIPAYNRAHLLDRALRSALTQKGVLFEIIVADDGSTDGTRELVLSVIARSSANSIGGTTKQSAKRREAPKGPWRSGEPGSLALLGINSATSVANATDGLIEIASSRQKSVAGLAMTTIRYFHQSNQGPAAARNLGISHSSGKFIAFLDSDDEWLPGKLKAQLQFFEENRDYLICQTEEIWIRNGRRVNPMKKHKKYGGLIFEKCLPLCIVSPSAVMMRREFFETVGLFDESFPACEDYDLWLRVSARMPIGLIEKAYVVKYGGHPDQRSRQFPVMDRFRLKALRKILESGILNAGQKKAAMHELERKSFILEQGALKRGKSKADVKALLDPRG